MSGWLSTLRSHAVSADAGTALSVAASDAAARAADMAANPWEYEMPAWVKTVGKWLELLRARNRRSLAFKRRLAGGAGLVLLALWLYRRYQAHVKQRAKVAALAAQAREAAAAAGGELFSPSRSPEPQSLGDRLLHPPSEDGLIPVPLKSKGERKAATDKGGKPKVAVDALFLRRLRKILSITIPSVYSTEFAYLTVLTALLFARTFFSIYIAELVGLNAQSMVSRKWGRMWHGIKIFAVITIPASAVNSGLKYFQEILALRFRQKLSQYVHEVYLDGTNFYKACNLGGSERIDNADQRVTADIKNFSEEIAALYASLLKPLLDVVLFTWKLGTLLGWQGPAAMHGYFFLSGVIKRKIMPNLGRLVARESELEGFYRTAHNRLITNSEEIAFYDGSRKEKVIINNALQAICIHISYARWVKALVGVFDGLLVKYYASIAGYCTLLSPFIFNKNAGASTSDLTRDYIRNSSYLGNLSTAVGQLVMVGNKLTSIAGYTSRVSELLEQVKHLNEAGNEPFVVKPEAPHPVEHAEEGTECASFMASWRARCDAQAEQRFEIRHAASMGSHRNNKQVQQHGVVGGGTIRNGPEIVFEHVDIVSPEGKMLVKDLNFTVPRGTNVMITGPNGVGKSSLFRIIGELWPLHSGVLTKPPKEEILFVPQRPYLVIGTLRDQIIYPHEHADMKRLGVTDEDLGQLLAIVDPARNITTEWTWDTVKDWFHAFSGGQKQRIAMARLFYHRPTYAILDECTSAVSDEVEGTIYTTCRKLGITIFTVSHRPQLAKYHELVLRFEGETRWSTRKIDSQTEIERERREKALINGVPLAASSGSDASSNAATASAIAAPAAAVVTEASASQEFDGAASSARAASPSPALVPSEGDAAAAATSDMPAEVAPSASHAQHNTAHAASGGKKKKHGKH